MSTASPSWNNQNSERRQAAISDAIFNTVDLAGTYKEPIPHSRSEKIDISTNYKVLEVVGQLIA